MLNDVCALVEQVGKGNSCDDADTDEEESKASVGFVGPILHFTNLM